jgi:L-rhamnose mutarotase
MKRCVFALDLKEDPKLIREYEEYHRNVWPDILESIKASGIAKMEIFRVANRMVMIMETTDDFSLSRKSEMDMSNPKVMEWEELMWKFQQALPFAKDGEKWVEMHSIFRLANKS